MEFLPEHDGAIIFTIKELLRLVFVKNLQTKFCFTLKCKKQQTGQALDPVKLDKITATRRKNPRSLNISTMIVHYKSAAHILLKVLEDEGAS